MVNQNNNTPELHMSLAAGVPPEQAKKEEQLRQAAISTSEGEPRKKVYFVRIPAEIYSAIQKVADEQGRTIQMQTQILLGAALNDSYAASFLNEAIDLTPAHRSC